MIISHKYKYLFIQTEKTASTAIAKELCKNYNGAPILWKHARYEDFLAIATPKEKKYFIFAGIRNPLDAVVSLYYMRKKGIDNKSTNFLFKIRENLKKHNFIKKNNADFTMFFKKFYGNKIYNNDWKTRKFHLLNYIYRYENLQKDFSEILKKIGIKQKRPLPLFWETPNKKKDFESYYSKDIQPRAKIVFNKYMKKWNYKFPENWKKPTIWDKIFISIPLNIRYFLGYLIYFIVGIPFIYKKLYSFKEK